MNKGILIACLLAGNCFAHKTQSFCNFRYGGYLNTTNFVEDTSVLKFPLPSDIIVTDYSVWQRLLWRVSKKCRDEAEQHFLKNLSFWRRRFDQRLYALEKAFYASDQAVFFAQLENLKKDMCAVADSDANSVFSTFWFSLANMSFFRLLESGTPQCSWLTPDVLAELFEGIRWKFAIKDSVEGVKTNWNMLVVISALIHYRNLQGNLPESLAQLRLPDQYFVDGWGHPLVYRVKDREWFLKSKGSAGTDGQIEFDHLDDIKTWKVFYFEGRSTLHWELYQKGTFRCHGIE